MFLRLFAFSSVLLSLFGVVACSDAPSESKVAVPDPAEAEAPEPVLKTSGVLHFDGLPPGSVSAAEVLIVSELSDAARVRIERQRELFEYKITGRVEAAAEMAALAGVSAADSAHLVAALAELSGDFPPVFIKNIDLGNNRLRKYQSDVELFKEYQYLFRAIQWENLERGLKFIAEKVKADHAALVTRADAAEDEAYEQIGATLDWLESVQAHYGQYVDLGHEYVEAQKRYLRVQAALDAKPSEPTDWDAYVAKYANTLFVDTSEHLLGAAFAAEDGSFEVEGHGTLIVRVELGVVSVYFFPGSEEEQRVRAEAVQQL